MVGTLTVVNICICHLGKRNIKSRGEYTDETAEILVVSFPWPKKPLRQISPRRCCIARDTTTVFSCDPASPVYTAFLCSYRYRYGLAGHHVDGGDHAGRRGGKRDDIYASFLLRFSPREQNGNNMSPGREGRLVARRGRMVGGRGLRELLVGGSTGGT